MKIEELEQTLKDFNNIPETNKHWNSRIMSYENEYINVVSLDDSNKHNIIDYDKFDKMWSIIYHEKKNFSHLSNYNVFKNLFNAYTSPVYKGKNKGCLAIRIPNMKQCPTIDIALYILNYIFEL